MLEVRLRSCCWLMREDYEKLEKGVSGIDFETVL